MARTRSTLLLAAVALGLALGPAAAPVSAADPQVKIQHYAFVDPVVEVQAKRPISWVNVDPLNLQHNVVTDTFAPPGGQPAPKTIQICRVMKVGERPCIRADLAPGTYTYTCTINAVHAATMHAVLIVR